MRVQPRPAARRPEAPARSRKTKVPGGAWARLPAGPWPCFLRHPRGNDVASSFTLPIFGKRRFIYADAETRPAGELQEAILDGFGRLAGEPRPHAPVLIRARIG